MLNIVILMVIVIAAVVVPYLFVELVKALVEKHVLEPARQKAKIAVMTINAKILSVNRIKCLTLDDVKARNKMLRQRLAEEKERHARLEARINELEVKIHNCSTQIQSELDKLSNIR